MCIRDRSTTYKEDSFKVKVVDKLSTTKQGALFVNISESFKIAVKAIKANWMRSLLTMLGIIIGISSCL